MVVQDLYALAVVQESNEQIASKLASDLIQDAKARLD